MAGTHQETTSGNTGSTVFDFNGDGAFEVVYRDEAVPIHNQRYGWHHHDNHRPCKSLTWTEYPVVADVDGDGATEICVTCMMTTTPISSPCQIWCSESV